MQIFIQKHEPSHEDVNANKTNREKKKKEEKNCVDELTEKL